MKFCKICFVALLSGDSSASVWGGRSPSSRDEAVRYDPDPATFDPADLLDPKTEKPEMWARAISELQEFKKKPSCSRLAASMLMNDCQLLEGVNGSNSGRFPAGVEVRLEDYINGYAASLAICDIEAAQGPIPEACEPFRETALLKFTERRAGEALNVSKKQIDQCMNGLIKVSTSWTSWTSSRDRATLFCRASRIDIEKDQLIALHQSIAKILQSMIVDSQIELAKRRAELAAQDLATKSYFRHILAQLGNVRDGISTALSEVADHVKNIQASLHNTSKHAEDVQQVLTNVRKTLLDANADHVSVQKAAVHATSDLIIHSRDARTELNAIHGLLMEVNLNAISINAALVSMQKRQNALDAQSNQATFFLKNLTDALQGANSLGNDQLINMARLKQITSELQESVETASRSASTWTRYVSSFTGVLGISWPLLILSPPLTLFFCSYGLSPSLIRNLALLFAGFPIAKFLTMVIKLEMGNMEYPLSSVSHLPKGNSSRPTIVTTPASFKSFSSSDLFDDFKLINIEI